MTFIGTKYGVTRFDEQLTALRQSRMNFKPTWGVSELRYFETTSGSATVTESGGEFNLDTSAASGDVVVLTTREKGTYRAGTTAQVGIGARYRENFGSDQYAQWGYYTDENGFGWGVDNTDTYVFYTTNSSQTKTYQTNWNIDALDGNGRSGLTFDPNKGHIFLIEFLWYGYGDIMYYIMMDDGNEMVKVPVHRTKIDNSVSIVDPNQPIRFEVNNGTTATAQNLYIGGHQFSLVDGTTQPEVRPVGEILEQYTLANNSDWQPLIAVRSKTTFNGRPNSVNVTVRDFAIATDVDIEARLTLNGTTSNLSWGDPTGWTSTETGAETKVTGGTALTTSADGNPIKYGLGLGGSNKASRTIRETASITLGGGEEAILWVKQQTAAASTSVSAYLEWTEEW